MKITITQTVSKLHLVYTTHCLLLDNKPINKRAIISYLKEDLSQFGTDDMITESWLHDGYDQEGKERAKHIVEGYWPNEE